MTVHSDVDLSSVPTRGAVVEIPDQGSALTMARDVDTGLDVLALEHGAARLARSKLKRILDFGGALFGLLLLSPLLVCVSLAICLDSPGSPLFTQRRSGYRGLPFVIYKFRTMRVREDGNRIEQARRDDPRITKVGRFLRRTSIDELPQLFNVLIGEMSLVGPRPHAVAHDQYYGTCVQFYSSRFQAKPGLTGLAQVSGFRGQTIDIADMTARVEKDLQYIMQWSFLTDLRILCKTLVIFAFHPAAY